MSTATRWPAIMTLPVGSLGVGEGPGAREVIADVNADDGEEATSAETTGDAEATGVLVPPWQAAIIRKVAR
jgi:hypothetical protein